MKKGDKLIHIGKMSGKPPIAYLMSDPDGHIIFVSDKPKDGKMIAVHAVKFEKEWKLATKQKKKSKGSPEILTGKQTGIFAQPKTVREMWREQMIKG
jgi:hypothetical protein